MVSWIDVLTSGLFLNIMHGSRENVRFMAIEIYFETGSRVEQMVSWMDVTMFDLRVWVQNGGHLKLCSLQDYFNTPCAVLVNFENVRFMAIEIFPNWVSCETMVSWIDVTMFDLRV